MIKHCFYFFLSLSLALGTLSCGKKDERQESVGEDSEKTSKKDKNADTKLEKNADPESNADEKPTEIDSDLTETYLTGSWATRIIQSSIKAGVNLDELLSGVNRVGQRLVFDRASVSRILNG